MYASLTSSGCNSLSLRLDTPFKLFTSFDTDTFGGKFTSINLFRRKKRVICEGLIYGKSNSLVTRFLRKIFIESSEGVLVYSNLVMNRLSKETKKPIIAFNNSSYSKLDIKPIALPELNDRLNIIWVGRYQERKKLERLYDLAKLDSRVRVRLIGPGINEIFSEKIALENFQVFSGVYGDELEKHFAWSHVVFNPGGAGLLVMNAARSGRSIVIDNNSYHGPEIQLAIDAKQDFIDFSNLGSVKKYIDSLFEKTNYLQNQANSLTEQMEHYTIEHMAEKYYQAIQGKWS
ncbi:hypothetical protein AKN92_10545 [Thiopseudomonas alkaliphila]|nr:hypothetical protein AKN92_10545 [Thiopseudomonas alkaliphila]